MEKDKIDLAVHDKYNGPYKIHFYSSIDSDYTRCGKKIEGNMKVTTVFYTVDCENCLTIGRWKK